MFEPMAENFEMSVNPDTKAGFERDGERETHKQNMHRGKSMRRMGNEGMETGRDQFFAGFPGRGPKLGIGTLKTLSVGQTPLVGKCGGFKRYGF
jgi:hypothetical protein